VRLLQIIEGCSSKASGESAAILATNARKIATPSVEPTAASLAFFPSSTMEPSSISAPNRITRAATGARQVPGQMEAMWRGNGGTVCPLVLHSNDFKYQVMNI